MRIYVNTSVREHVRKPAMLDTDADGAWVRVTVGGQEFTITEYKDEIQVRTREGAIIVSPRASNLIVIRKEDL